MNHAFSDIMNIYYFKDLTLYDYFDNQEYTIPPQSGRKKCNVALLGDKNFMKDRKCKKPLDDDIGRVTIKILHSLTLS